MIYRVVMDGNDILDYGDRDLSLIDPHLELEINAAGSLEFVMPPNHKYYDAIRIRKSTIEVYEDDTMIWFGRPIDQKIDFFKQKKIYCEGPLSFFNDSIMRPLEMENITLHGFFSTAVYSHNGQVDDNRMFTVGNITIPDSTVYRKFDYETTYDVLQKMCIETNDGYLFFRRQNNVNYIDWLKDMPFSCNQTIRFGINLLNYSSNFDTSDFATCVLPVGKADSETGEALTIASINGGSDIIVSEAAQTYGKVTQVVRLSDITDQYELMSEGQKYLENSQFNALNIECTAADLHSMNPDLELFRVGQNVHCVSEPHLVDRDFPLSKMQINLDSAAKLITLGIIKRRTLTRIYKQETESTESYQPEQYQPEQYDPGIIEDENGEEWEIKPPEENGDPVTAIRMPIKITIAKPPNKTEYAPGETIDYAGISVNIWTKNKGDQEVIWTNPPKYLDGKAPFAELSFSMKNAPNQEGMEGFSVIVTWKYKGKSYSANLGLTSKNTVLDPFPLQRPIPASPTGSMKFGPQTQNYSFSAGSGLYTQWLVTNKTCGHLAASANPGAALSMTNNYGSKWTYQLSKTFTYNGKTVYYWYVAEGGKWSGIYNHGSPLCNGGAFVTGVSEHSAASAAWIMIYGG